MVPTDVGGIPEIFGPFRDRLLPPDDVAGSGDAMMRHALAIDPGASVRNAPRTRGLRRRDASRHRLPWSTVRCMRRLPRRDSRRRLR